MGESVWAVLVCKMAGLAYYYPALLAVLIHQAAANNQTGEDFTVKINQDGVAKRSFCCLFAKDHCSEPCQDKKCSAKCIVECGEDGVFKCPGIPCRDSTPKTWIGAQDWLDEGKFSWVDGTWIDPT